MYAEMAMRNELLKDALGKKAAAPVPGDGHERS
jgi:hypothetical protein